MTEIITTEEKIDYIYKTLKSNQKKALIGWIFKWWFRLFILIYLYYFVTKGLPAMVDSIIPSLQNLPWVNLTEALGGESTSEILKNLNTDELIDNPQMKSLLDSYLKK